MDLKQFFAEHPRAAVAFSGGVDSAFLLSAAASCGADVKAYYVRSQFQPEFELEDARKLAALLGVPMEILPLDILSHEAIAANPPDRCYHCKKAIFRRILAAAAADGFDLLLDGTNASDAADDRPGMRALAELSVRSPLRECGLTKTEIRQRSKDAGLFTHDKPAYACLATRISAGEPITAEKLRRTEKAEAWLAELGFRDFRIRSSGDAARIQVTARDLPGIIAQREMIARKLKQDYASVTLDLEVRE